MNRPDPSIQGERVAYRVPVATLNASHMACSGRRIGRADLTHCCVLSRSEVRATFRIQKTKAMGHRCAGGHRPVSGRAVQPAIATTGPSPPGSGLGYSGDEARLKRPNSLN
jgi:hypothetical protein